MAQHDGSRRPLLKSVNLTSRESYDLDQITLPALEPLSRACPPPPPPTCQGGVRDGSGNSAAGRSQGQRAHFRPGGGNKRVEATNHGGLWWVVVGIASEPPPDPILSDPKITPMPGVGSRIEARSLADPWPMAWWCVTARVQACSSCIITHRQFFPSSTTPRTSFPAVDSTIVDSPAVFQPAIFCVCPAWCRSEPRVWPSSAPVPPQDTARIVSEISPCLKTATLPSP